MYHQKKMAKRNVYQTNYRTTNASQGKKAKRNEYQQNCRASSLSMESTITKFHQILSQGPRYVCTCCDQLWYKHSVTNADQIRQSISDIIKYLNNKYNSRRRNNVGMSQRYADFNARTSIDILILNTKDQL